MICHLRFQQLKNGTSGARNRAPQVDYGDRSYTQQSYTTSQGQQTQGQAPTAVGAEDPYAACKQHYLRRAAVDAN
jgi:hypothetical protein